MFAKALKMNSMQLVQLFVTWNYRNCRCCRHQCTVSLQVSAGARKKYAKPIYLVKLWITEIRLQIQDWILHFTLDHGEDMILSSQRRCVDDGFTSVMIDGSNHSIRHLTQQVVEYAHSGSVCRRSQGLGESSPGSWRWHYVDVRSATLLESWRGQPICWRTSVDSLAIAIGTNHGAYKFKGEHLDLKIEKIHALILKFSHTGTSRRFHGFAWIRKRCNDFGE